MCQCGKSNSYYHYYNADYLVSRINSGTNKLLNDKSPLKPIVIGVISFMVKCRPHNIMSGYLQKVQ